MPDSAGVLPQSGGWRSESRACGRAAGRARRLPPIAYGRPSSRAAPCEIARLRARRGCACWTRARRPACTGSISSATKPSARPHRRSSAMSPARPLPKRNSGPTQTSRADRRCRSTMRRRTPRPSGRSASLSKRSRPTWSTPSASRPSNLARGSNSRGGGLAAGEELARQRLEAQRDRRQAQFARTQNGAAHQRLMPEMQAVEGADADHTAVRATGPAFDVPKQPAHG